MKKTDLWIYRISTGLITALFAPGAVAYFVQYDMTSEMFTSLGFPTFIIYPLAVLKLLGLVAIWTGRSKMLREWAYVGFMFDLTLATGSHINAADGEAIWPAIALVVVIVSYIFHRRVHPTYVQD